MPVDDLIPGGGVRPVPSVRRSARRSRTGRTRAARTRTGRTTSRSGRSRRANRQRDRGARGIEAPAGLPDDRGFAGQRDLTVDVGVLAVDRRRRWRLLATVHAPDGSEVLGDQVRWKRRVPEGHHLLLTGTCQIADELPERLALLAREGGRHVRTAGAVGTLRCRQGRRAGRHQIAVRRERVGVRQGVRVDVGQILGQVGVQDRGLQRGRDVERRRLHRRTARVRRATRPETCARGRRRSRGR